MSEEHQEAWIVVSQRDCINDALSTRSVLTHLVAWYVETGMFALNSVVQRLD
jgi:hypothetical protein